MAKSDENSEKLAADFNKMGPKLAKGIFRDVNEIIKKSFYLCMKDYKIYLLLFHEHSLELSNEYYSLFFVTYCRL